MQYGARIQAVIDILEIFEEDKQRPFDRIVHSYIKERRYIGSKDRHEIADKAYGVLRHWFSYQKSLGSEATPRLMIGFHEKRWPDPCEYGPSPLTELERKKLLHARPHDLYLLPDFLKDLFSHPGIIPSLYTTPSVDLRVNLLKTTRDEALKTLGFGVPTPYSPFGIRLESRLPLNQHPLWQKGFVDIQDEGSQIAALLCDAKPGHRVLDLCAGAGGKTLALAALMENKGSIVATDTAEWRLERAKERLKKAGVHNTTIRLHDAKWMARQHKRFDRVLIDAPCSGSGTWRRHPDLKVKTTEESVRELTTVQETLLHNASFLVKPEGRLIYVTCSLFGCENEEQIKKFLTAHPDFHLIETKSLWESHCKGAYPGRNDQTLNLDPFHHQTDGFFVAVFERKNY